MVQFYYSKWNFYVPLLVFFLDVKEIWELVSPHNTLFVLPQWNQVSRFYLSSSVRFLRDLLDFIRPGLVVLVL